MEPNYVVHSKTLSLKGSEAPGLNRDLVERPVTAVRKDRRCKSKIFTNIKKSGVLAIPTAGSWSFYYSREL